MWINLERDQLELVAKHARANLGKEGEALADQIEAKLKSGFDPGNAAWVAKAKEIHEDEGSVEVDEQGDGSAMVSDNGENGAYVLAWVFVDYADVGMPYPAGADEDEDEAEDA